MRGGLLHATDLGSKRGSENERRQQRQHFGSPALEQRHVKQSEQQQDTRRRQSDASQQRKPYAEQQTDFESAELAEINRPKFHDQRQRVAQGQDFDRLHHRIPAIRRATRRNQRGQTERHPALRQRFT